MRKLVVLLWALMAVIALGLSGCSDPSDTTDDVQSNGNYMKVGNEVSELYKGYMAKYGSNPVEYNGCKFRLDLSANGPIEHPELALIMGLGVYFDLYSSSNSEIVPGVYNYTNSDHPAVGSFDSGAAGEYMFQETPLIVGGTIIVKKNGSIYSITFDCTDSDGRKITGYYEGELEFIDNSLLDY